MQATAENIERIEGTENPVFRVPANRLRDVEKAVNSITRRARRAGAGDVELKYGEPYDYDVLTYWAVERIETLGVREADLVARYGRRRVYATIQCVDVEVIAEPVRVPGWTFVGRIEHRRVAREENGEATTSVRNLVHHVPGHEEDFPREYREAESNCDHCQTQRFRKDTYVVRSDNGEYRQIGRTCLQEYFGINPAHVIGRFQLWDRILDHFKCVDDDEVGYGCGGYFPKSYPLQTYLLYVAECISRWGWVSKSAARARDAEHHATADVAWDHAYPSRHLAEIFAREGGRIEYEKAEKWEADVDAALKWVRELDDAKTNDYLHNLKSVCLGDHIEPKDAGLAASLIQAYYRAQERELKKAEQLKDYENVHVGEVGKRYEWQVEYRHCVGFETCYGYGNLLKFREVETGAQVVWFTSANLSEWDWRPHTIFRIKATVKEHGDYKGSAQTVVTRAKVLGIVEDNTAE